MRLDPSPAAVLGDNRDAFDGVASIYDGPAGNNRVIRWLRQRLWEAVAETFPAGSRLLDLGCGTGIDAAHLAALGYEIVAVDWSPRMVARTRERVEATGTGASVTTRVLGMHELTLLEGEQFDGVYSNLGALNCAPSLDDVAVGCRALLRPGGRIVTSVIGRACPWELALYLARGKPRRAFVRWSRDMVPVPLDGRTVWTRYYTPRQFYRPFAPAFELASYQGLCILPPPPYLLGVWERFPRVCERAAATDLRIGRRPLLRDLGDHFLMTLARM